MKLTSKRYFLKTILTALSIAVNIPFIIMIIIIIIVGFFHNVILAAVFRTL